MSVTKTYFRRLMPVFHARHAGAVRSFYPATETGRKEPTESKVDVYDYNARQVSHLEFTSVQKCDSFKNNGHITWINVDGLRKADVEILCTAFGVHPLLIEDILSVGQRPKMDESGNVLFCLLNMLYFNKESNCIEQEQVSIVLGKEFVLSFQEEAFR